MLKGKQGASRRNLLGKRVTIRGARSSSSALNWSYNQAACRRHGAELFRPFVIQKLVEYNYANNVKGAKRIVEQQRPEVWKC